MKKVSFVYTKDSYCAGCNKCIFVCPTSANEAFFETESNKVFIKPGYCISCGECINICDHGARDFNDDTKQFFSDIDKGKNISVVIAPSGKFNFSSVKRLTGYLKSIGVKNVYDVSFGADICTWAHVKAIKENGLSNIISQPCPVVVSYIEKYKPVLKDKLSPIQSPAVCLGIYLKKHLKKDEKIMFLSPCIGKKRECISKETFGVLDYNSTFIKFNEYLEQNNIELNNYPETEFDITDSSLGFVFPRPGGLSENIKYHLNRDIWIKEIEGIAKIKKYLNDLCEDINNNRPTPMIIDALNCELGCSLGTGTNKKASINKIDYSLNQSKNNIDKADSENLFQFFDDNLKLSDYYRKYVDQSKEYTDREDINLEAAFISLGKFNEADRNINCFSCGYGNCYDFAHELAAGHNNKNNCKFYLLNKFKTMSQYDELTGLNNRNCFNMDFEKLKNNYPGVVGIVYVDINGLKQCNDTKGHSCGDQMIISCSCVLKNVFGKQAYRVGGDEFVILCSDKSEEEFLLCCETLHNQLNAEKNLSASMGVAISCSLDELEDKMDEADQKMYEAKKQYYKNIQAADRRRRYVLDL